MKEYVVIYITGPRNWSAYVPDLPGWLAQATRRWRDDYPSADEYIGRSPEGTRAGLGAARRSARYA